MVNTAYGEKLPVDAPGESHEKQHFPPAAQQDVEEGHHEQAGLARGLQGRHMQMIAIGKIVTVSLRGDLSG